MTIRGLYNKVKKFDTQKAIDNAFESTVDELADQNKKQLFEGYDKTGEKIKRKYRSNKYARVKNEMNPLPGLGTPDLKVTGSFYRGIRVDYSGGTLRTKSTDEKGDDLEAKYDNIYGLGGEFKKDFVNDSLRPALNSGITSAIGLKFKS